MRAVAAAVLCAATLGAAPVGATGFYDYGQDLRAAPPRWFDAGGYLRLRGAAFYNLDLDRGPDSAGRPLFPVDVADPRGQVLTSADMRLRTDVTAYWPEGGAAVKVRVDALDNLQLGSMPDGIPSASERQRPHRALTIQRAYGEVLTPLGLIAAGRMGSHWGLGMLSNGGDCQDCDSGDAADRVAFVTPLYGHLWALAYDFTATGHLVQKAQNTAVDLAPSARVNTFTAALMRYKTPLSRERRRRAGRFTGEYGGYLSHRWQGDDVPASYLPTAQPVTVTPAQVMHRGYRATAVDAWLRITGPVFRVAVEAAYLHASVDQPSLIPGVLLRGGVTSDQWGAALESELGDPLEGAAGGIDGGFASGDRAPGFGAVVEPGAATTRPGQLDGPQASPPLDNQVQNFRFHPDYRVDRILFREIVGTVTDAIYLRPHFAYRAKVGGKATVTVALAAVASWAVYPESTPGGSKALGLEIDPSIAFDSGSGFSAALEQGTLFPFAGLDNPAAGLVAQRAQVWRTRLVYAY